MIDQKRLTSRGQSFFEVVFAVGVAAMIITAVVALASRNIKNASYSRDKTLATRHIQDAVERLREIKDEDWTNNLLNLTDGTYCLKDTSSGYLDSSADCTINGSTSFTREVGLTRIDDNNIKVEITVTDNTVSPPTVSRSITEITNWDRPVP